METTKLRRFAQFARRTLLELVETRLQLVLQPDSAARREAPGAVKQLEMQILESSREQVIERVAYTWFNRFCALRYMDVNRVNRINVVSAVDGQFQPEMLAEAKMGHIDEEMVPAAIQAKVRALLDGTASSSDPQQEAYRLLVVAVCNFWQAAMPFLFEVIADYTELLMPDDLLSGNSILAYTREAMTPDACEDVEVIGWLYQFYISEKKDEVFEGLKKNKKITPENIPAATQLFTPHWIVRYLVENSLGRLWLLNRPNSKLAGQMDYYIAPQEAVTDFLRIAKPEDIRLCDPACGSGHMLTYAFDLLYAIYEEEGADPVDIPEKILTHNLYGIEIDERAAELAAFALAMKARGKQRRFLNRRIQPNICVLRPIKIAPQDLDAYVAEVGRDLFTANLRTLLTQFEEADNFGSLIRPVAMDYAEIRRVLAEKGIGNQLLLEHVHRDVLLVLEQAEYLSQRYQVVVANPPYMGSGNMAPRLKVWLNNHFPNGKSDLMTAFMEMVPSLVVEGGSWGMINLPAWMFLEAHSRLRTFLLSKQRFLSLLHLGRGIFGADFGSVAFVIEQSPPKTTSQTTFFKLFENHVDVRQPETIEKIFLTGAARRFQLKQSELNKIPGSPIAYWANENVRRAFSTSRTLSAEAEVKTGLIAGENERFIREWSEVCASNIFWDQLQPVTFDRKWYFLLKGGIKRKWYGNLENVVNYQSGGAELISSPKAMLRNKDWYFKSGIHWNRLSNEAFGARLSPGGCIFEDLSPSLFSPMATSYYLPYLNSKVAQYFLKLFTSGRKTEIGHVGNLPIPTVDVLEKSQSQRLIAISAEDWDSFETSLRFSANPLSLQTNQCAGIREAFGKLRDHCDTMTKEMRHLEEQNNRIFIEAYGLQDELMPDVPLSEITLTCNPHYRYGGKKSEQELEDLLCADTMREFISYAVGCLFGRYSLDKPGLILANQGETLEDYLRQVPEPRFTPDADNVIPLLDGDWFPDDITGRFREFLRVTFGDDHYDENLRFIETALGKKGKPLPIRDFFLKDFYSDHVKRYKKRPIYWLFSSPKGSFNALIYLHRYRPDTVSIVLQYLRDFRSKLVSERDHQEQMSISGSASPGEKTKALKRIEELKKILVELDDYERETLYPLATHQVALDLDDGVKVNYGKLGAALKKIPGLDAVDE